MNNKTQKFELPEFGWWIEILTNKPIHRYYFGVFESYRAAESAKHGYIQDLITEGAEIINIEIERCQPQPSTTSVIPVSA